MKLKLLLLSLLLTGMLNAQDTIRTFIITEARVDRNDQSYVELTNIGTEPLQMSQFEFGRVGAWTDPYSPVPGDFMRLPEKELAPGESFVIAATKKLTELMYPLKPDLFNRRITKIEWWDLADMLIEMYDENSVYASDGISTEVSPYSGIMETWGGRETWYIEQHFENGDSVVVDQVGGVFDSDEGRNIPQNYDVAGVTGAWGTHILVRKPSVTQGNTNFADARGIDISDSEWMPIPRLYNDWEPYRAVFWTVGHHGHVTMDENTLVSETLEVDWNGKTITAPWGVRNNDDFMFEFEKVPGLAWHYDLSPAREDSAYNSARTGDVLTIYATGHDDPFVFDIVVKEPTADANIVMTKYAPTWNPEGSFYPNSINSGEAGYHITVNAPGMDTITSGLFGIGYSTRADSLLKYLEKAPKAEWEFIWVDGVARPDLKNGDKLKVTAENGAVKEYYIKVDQYRPSHNAYLTAITWPDIPEWMQGLFGWKGDTIPNFNTNVMHYTVQVPAEVTGIPALLAKTQQLNSRLDVKRASSLDGTEEQKTVKFTVTAEDDTTVNVYNVKLEKELSFDDIQPFEAEPFLSELIFNEQWSNGFIEVCNPGNQRLDLSDYMMVFTYADQEGAITSYSGDEDWFQRYRKYIPGYKWVDETTWTVSPGTLVEDLNVSPFVEPGGVFVMGQINGTGQSGYPWFASEVCDVIFNTAYNPWGETFDQWASAANEWYGGNWYMFKIVGEAKDSIKNGLKPANDPNDFELIEVFGHGDESQWVVGGRTVEQIMSYVRKPEYIVGKTNFGESFGETPEDSEWTWTNRAYWTNRGYGWPQDILMVASDLGKHFFYPPTEYQSTISSIVYKVSDGYKKESIRGVKTGTTVDEFLANILKKNEGQTLSVVALDGGSELLGDELLSLNDTLVVVSADGVNTTKYGLNVTEDGLSPDAYLTSNIYDIEVLAHPKSAGSEDAGSGTIKGFEYGTQLRTILNNIIVPENAVLSIIDDKDAYVPLRRLNFDTAYVNVTVNHLTFFEVVAEDGVTSMVYQLLPTVSQSSAFVMSDIYSVVQRDLLIQYVPRGTSVDAFMSNIIPSLGATVKLVDNMGHERTTGQIAEDDKIVVTAPDGITQVTYYLAMLRTAIKPAPDYLAYVLSDVYTVDQYDMVIVGQTLTAQTLVSDFHNRIRTSFGATAVVYDKDGNVKTTGDLDDGDWLEVTSADGKITVVYMLDLDLTTADKLAEGEILLYPNPTTGKVNINGLEQGTRVQVFNSVGAMINDIKADQSIETISLERQPSGMYLIVLTKDAQLLGQYKVIRK